MNRGVELYVLNRHAGGNRAHISFHKDGRCHFKVEDPNIVGGRKQAEWELPAPLPGSDVLRLATVVIPHRGLVLPMDFEGPEEDTVLIPPPPEGHQLDVDILVESGTVPMDKWPGQTSLDSRLVGRFSFYAETPDKSFLNVTVVSTLRPEGQAIRDISERSVNLPDGLPQPGMLRAVFFEVVEVDGQKLPILTEMPVGHMKQGPDPGRAAGS